MSIGEGLINSSMSRQQKEADISTAWHQIHGLQVNVIELNTSNASKSDEWGKLQLKMERALSSHLS